MLSYDGGVQHVEGLRRAQGARAQDHRGERRTYATMKKAGLNTEIFSGGGTGTYNIST